MEEYVVGMEVKELRADEGHDFETAIDMRFSVVKLMRSNNNNYNNNRNKNKRQITVITIIIKQVDNTLKSPSSQPKYC